MYKTTCRRLTVLLLLGLSMCHTVSASSSAFSISQSVFGQLTDGTDINQYLIKGPKIELSVINYGGIINRLAVPNRHGVLQDVVLGYDNMPDYQHKNRYFGVLVGRFANRISHGELSIDDKAYELETNSGPHHLHGGQQGFDKVFWQITPFTSESDAGLVLKHTNPDGHGGYPGELSVTVTYTINTNNQLSVQYRATTDQKTVFNPTQHSYFNLSGDLGSNIAEHQLSIIAKHYLPLHPDSIPTGEIKPVANTVFDLANERKISQLLFSESAEIKASKGIDHFWLSRRQRGDLLPFATLYHPESGRLMTVSTTEVGGQIYSGNYLNATVIGKNNTAYQKYGGLCIETGQFTNSPNNNFPTVWVTPEVPYSSETVYGFTIR